MLRWVQLLVFTGAALAAFATSVPHLAVALEQYGGASFSLVAFVTGFFSDLYINAAAGSQVTDFFGAWSACLVFALVELLRMRSTLGWGLLAVSPLGLFTGLFPAIEALRVWRKEDARPPLATDPQYLQFRILLYAVIALVSGVVTAAFMFNHFGPTAWIAVFDFDGADVQRYMKDFALSPAVSALGFNLSPLTLALAFALVLEAIRSKARLVPIALLAVTMPLGVTVTLPLYLLHRDLQVLRAQRSSSPLEPHRT